MTAALRIKGMKMREDSKVTGGIAAQFGATSFDNTRIVDLDGRRTINFSSLERKALIQDKDYYEGARKSGYADQPAITLQPSGESRRVAGLPCDVYQLEASIPLTSVMPHDFARMPSMASQLGSAVMAMKGTACLAANAPGWSDYRAFYAAASEFYRRAPSPDSPATMLIGAMAEKGIMVEMNVKGKLEGSGGGAIPLLSQIVSSFANMSMKVTSISTDRLPASAFDLPRGMPVTRISY
jgi:hypothetical protein